MGFYGLCKELRRAKFPPSEGSGFSGFAFTICGEVMSTVKNRSETALQRGLLFLQEQCHYTEAELSPMPAQLPLPQYLTWWLFTQSPKAGGSQAPLQMLSPQ